MKASRLLLIDAAITLLLAVPLLFYPAWFFTSLGLPEVGNGFYCSMLGAVLIGIGIALLVERFRGRTKATGVGLVGAMCIDLSAAVVLAVWLIGGSLSLPLRGYIVLWAVVVILGGVSILGISAQRRMKGEDDS